MTHLPSIQEDGARAPFAESERCHTVGIRESQTGDGSGILGLLRDSSKQRIRDVKQIPRLFLGPWKTPWMPKLQQPPRIPKPGRHHRSPRAHALLGRIWQRGTEWPRLCQASRDAVPSLSTSLNRNGAQSAINESNAFGEDRCASQGGAAKGTVSEPVSPHTRRRFPWLLYS